MTFFFVIFFQKIFTNLILISFEKSEILNPVVGSYQSTLHDGEYCLQIWLLISL